MNLESSLQLRILGSIYAPTDRDGVSANVSECYGIGEDAGDLIGAFFVFATEAVGAGWTSTWLFQVIAWQ